MITFREWCINELGEFGLRTSEATEVVDQYAILMSDTSLSEKWDATIDGGRMVGISTGVLILVRSNLCRYIIDRWLPSKVLAETPWWYELVQYEALKSVPKEVQSAEG